MIDRVDIVAGNLRFVPGGDGNGAGYASIGFQVGDGTFFSSTQTLTVNVTAVNDLPAATGMLTAFDAVDEDTPLTVTSAQLLAGYADADGGVLTIAALSADHGSVTKNADGTWTITPSKDFNGTMTLSYQVVDTQGGYVAATNSYVVDPVNDAPVLTASPSALAPTNEGSPTVIDAATLLGSYTDADGTTPFIEGNLITASHGATVVYDDASKTYTVTPPANFDGPITLSYVVTDGTTDVPITRVLNVTSVDSAPAVGAPLADQEVVEGKPFSFTLSPTAFTDADNQPLTYSAVLVDAAGVPIAGGTLPAWLHFDPQTHEFSGTPPADLGGDFHIQVVAGDGSQSVQDTFLISVGESDKAPVVANPPTDRTLDEVKQGFSLAGVFSDPNGDEMTVTPSLANGEPLPDWLTWNPVTQTLSGNPPGGLVYLDIKVTASDGTESVDSSFRINLTEAGLDPDNTGGISGNDAGSVTVAGNAGTAPYLLGTTLTATVADLDGFDSSSVVYHWQQSADGTTWQTIGGAGGTGEAGRSFTVGQAQSDQLVRVQAFYNDGGQVLEAPVSTAVGVALTDQPGAVTISGLPAAGQTLQATLTDPDGLLNATPVYTWYSGTSGTGPWAQVASTSSNAYTLTNDEGGKYVRVQVTYVDDEAGATRTVTGVLSSNGSPISVQLGAVAPVAADKTAGATEAGGVVNAVEGMDAEGNLVSGATDANAGEVISFHSVRTGSAPGLGAPALPDPQSPSTVVLQGTYGVLRVNTASGDYTYTVDNESPAVQALFAGQQVTESFNYSVQDSTEMTADALLTITVTGADDAPAGSGVPTSATMTEDVSTSINLGGLVLSDFDGAQGETYSITVSAATVGASLVAASANGVTVTGSGTGLLTATGTLASLNAFVANTSAVSYLSKANDDSGDTLTVQLHYGAGLVNTIDLGSVAVDLTAVNDAPTITLDANNSSGSTIPNGFLISFQPRSGEAVPVVDQDVVLGDVDKVNGQTDMLSMASVALTAGALDNASGQFEILTTVGANVIKVGDEVRYTFANYSAADAGAYLVVGGNATGKLTSSEQGRSSSTRRRCGRWSTRTPAALLPAARGPSPSPSPTAAASAERRSPPRP